ncbi:MAG: hypothetical protein ACQERU_14070 [Bacteroidota bacterium]
MRNFVILFQEKEGTSALVRMLDNFEEFTIIHQKKGGWEPFNVHNCGQMKFDDYFYCVDKVLNNRPIEIGSINKIYTKTARKPIAVFNKNRATGFKMRLYAPLKSNLLKVLFHPKFENRWIQTIKQNKTVIFISVRQDIFRWALSKYHGDGTGRKGHIQFKMASNKTDNIEIRKIHVNPIRLWIIIKICELRHQRKKMLYHKLKQKGIKVVPLLYEEFSEDKKSFLKKIYNVLEIPLTPERIEDKIRQEVKFKKVHSNDISTFVKNHKEIIKKFGNKYISWEDKADGT